MMANQFMDEHITLGLTLILVLGTSAQWLAWRFKLPSILLLLCFGFLAGPIAKWINPQFLLGDLLQPFVSLAVAVVLFEGGLSLNLREWRGSASIIIRFISIGALIGWLVVAWLAYFLLDASLGIALLTGAILIITGPTVIAPMLRAIRPRGRVRDILKWEGILNDPSGAIFAVLIMEAIVAGRLGHERASIVAEMLETLIVGLLIGGFFALTFIFIMRKKWVPDFLHNSVTLMLVMLSFVLANLWAEDAGLITVTLMGIVLANQKNFSVHHIIEFKENLQVLLIASLFIVLSAKLELSAFEYIGWDDFLFLLGLIFLARPLTVLVSTLGTKLPWNERFFLMLVAPRGIVVMAMTSVFAFRLSAHNPQEASEWLATILVVVIGSVSFYGLLAGPAAQWLKLANRNPRGILIVGAHAWARALASKLEGLNVPTILIDSNTTNIFVARRMGLNAYSGNIFSDEFLDLLDLSEMGMVLTVTSNDEVNTFAFNALSDLFDSAHYYKIGPNPDSGNAPSEDVKENILFGTQVHYGTLERRLLQDLPLELANYEEGMELGDVEPIREKGGIPLFLIDTQGKAYPFTVQEKHKGEAGAKILYWAGQA